MHIEKYTYMVLKAEPVRFIPHCSRTELVLTYTGMWEVWCLHLIPTLCGLPWRYRASPQKVSRVQHGYFTHIFSWQSVITSANNVTPSSVPFLQNLISSFHSKKVSSTGIFWWVFIGDKMILNIRPLLRNPLCRPFPQNSLLPISKVYYLLLLQNIVKCLSEPWWQVLSMSCSHPQAFFSVQAANCHLPSTEYPPLFCLWAFSCSWGMFCHPTGKE